MKYLLSIIFLILWFTSGCESPTSVQQRNPPADFQERLGRVIIEQVDYYTILFRNSDSLFVNPNEIEKIIFGYYKNELFIGVDTLTLTHTHSNSYSLLTFSDSLQVPDSLSSVTAGLKYDLINFDPLIIKKDFFLFSYPYQSTRIIIPYHTFLEYGDVQDFVYRPPVLYYHPTGSAGLYLYNLETGEKRTLIEYPGGDFIDGNSTDIFIDVGYAIRRFNLNTNTVTVQKTLQDLLGNYPGPNIKGIAVNDIIVFVLIGSADKLLTLNADLEILDMKDFSADVCYSMTYYKGYLYTPIYKPDNRFYIIKIDPETGIIKDEKKSPTLHTASIKISEEGVLYFVDDKFKVFCYTWLDDIFPE